MQLFSVTKMINRNFDYAGNNEAMIQKNLSSDAKIEKIKKFNDSIFRIDVKLFI